MEEDTRYALVKLGKQIIPHPTSQQVARAGEYLVAAELHRRGAYAVTFTGTMPRIDIVASNAALTRTVMIQVKTKRSGTWQASTRAGKPRQAVPEEQRFWIFVDLRKNPLEPPAYYIVHEWWIQNDFHEAHQAYLKRAGCTRRRSAESTHHAIQLRRIKDSKDRWDRIGIF